MTRLRVGIEGVDDVNGAVSVACYRHLGDSRLDKDRNYPKQEPGPHARQCAHGQPPKITHYPHWGPGRVIYLVAAAHNEE